MSVAAARPAVVGVAMRATDGAATAAVPTAVLSRREAGLRSAATSCMALVALVQTVALPSLFGQGALYVALSGSAAALCIAMGLALAAAPAGPGRHVWRLVAATATLLLAGWAVPRIVALPGPAGTRGLWGSLPGAACAASAAACLLLALAALRPARAAVRSLAAAVALMLALVPGVAAFLVATGPGPAGGETSIAADVHVHVHSLAPEPDIVLRRGAKGNHYLTPVARPPHPSPIGVALVVAAASVFVAAAVASLWRRTASAGAGAAAEGRPAWG